MSDQLAHSNRIEHLREQYDRGIQFHRQEFSEIEAKVKYWLTFLLPTSVGLLGYLLKNDDSTSGIHFTSTLVATLFLLVAVIITLALSLQVASIQAGILRPDPPELSRMDYYTKGKVTDWDEYLEREVIEMLRAFQNNESANSRKAKWLIRGQTLLFFGVPAAPAFAIVGGEALLYTCAHQVWFPLCLSTTPSAIAGVGVGAAAGIVVAGILLLTSHSRTS